MAILSRFNEFDIQREAIDPISKKLIAITNQEVAKTIKSFSVRLRVKSKTIKEIPQKLSRVINQGYTKNPNLTFKLSHAGKNRYCAIVPLSDASGRFVGEIVVLNDISVTFRS